MSCPVAARATIIASDVVSPPFLAKNAQSAPSMVSHSSSAKSTISRVGRVVQFPVSIWARAAASTSGSPYPSTLGP